MFSLVHIDWTLGSTNFDHIVEPSIAGGWRAGVRWESDVQNVLVSSYNRNPQNGYLNAYEWIDDHSPQTIKLLTSFDHGTKKYSNQLCDQAILGKRPWQEDLSHSSFQTWVFRTFGDVFFKGCSSGLNSESKAGCWEPLGLNLSRWEFTWPIGGLSSNINKKYMT